MIWLIWIGATKMAMDRENLLATMLNEPTDQLRLLLASKAVPHAEGADTAAVAAMRELALRYPYKPPNGLRFEILLYFLLHDGSLAAQHAREILSAIQDDSDWLYGGILVAAHAGEFAGESWLREHYPKLPPDLQIVLRMLLDKMNPALGRMLAILP